jgi:precorrin-6Y C5,15-methyltransferase (decarboxylating)
MKIALIGIGMGNRDTLTIGAEKRIKEADCLIGAKRILQSFSDISADKFEEINSEKIAEIIKSNGYKNICVLLSGDIGIYSGAKGLYEHISAYEIDTYPGISTVQYLASKLKKPWQEMHLATAHGIETDILPIILSHKECFFTTGGKITPKTMISDLVESNLEDIVVHIGENLSYENECITSGKAKELYGKDFSSLSAVILENPYFSAEEYVNSGLPDEVFNRGSVPMTKSEVRSIILSKLKVRENDLIYDIGAGTGSISIELGRLLKNGTVYAIDHNGEACGLIRENARKFHLGNIKVVEGAAPEALKGLPMPNAAFIGGSKGNIEEIIETLLNRNPNMRIAASAITLETVLEVLASFKKHSIENSEIIEVNISRSKPAGEKHMMLAQNPIYIISGGVS